MPTTGLEHWEIARDTTQSVQIATIEPFQAVRDLVPQVVVRIETKSADGQKEERLINLLDAGHRAADAIVRFSSLSDSLGRAIKSRRDGDSLPLAKIAPTSLVFGMWDSRDTGVKVPRLISSIIRAYDVFEYRRSAQYFPAADYAAAGVAADSGEKGLKKLADQGMAEVPATFGLGGIEAKGGICRDASLNLVTLRDIVTIAKEESAGKKEIDKRRSREESLKLQRYLLGLALVSLTWFDGRTLNLRQGCQLVAVAGKPMTRLCVNANGTDKEFQIDRDVAVEYARETARAFGVEKVPEARFDPKEAKNALKKKASEEAG